VSGHSLAVATWWQRWLGAGGRLPRQRQQGAGRASPRPQSTQSASWIHPGVWWLPPPSAEAARSRPSCLARLQAQQQGRLGCGGWATQAGASGLPQLLPSATHLAGWGCPLPPLGSRSRSTCACRRAGGRRRWLPGRWQPPCAGRWRQWWVPRRAGAGLRSMHWTRPWCSRPARSAC
jgi:hypothetical protein